MLVGQQLWVKSAEGWQSRRLYPHLPPNHLIPPFAHTQVKLVFHSHTSQASLSLTQNILLIRVFSLNFLLTKKRAPVLFVSSLFFCC